MNHYDIIIIGTGAGGSTMAYRLANTGKKILILERGDFLPKERENWDPEAVFAKGRYLAKEKWFDKENKSFQPFTHYWVGGNTKMYGAALLRLRESDFEAVDHFDGISPAWPLKYSDFEPYYTEAEYLYSVHGERGIDPTEPPASKPYPFPAIPHEPRMQKLYDDFIKLGRQPSPLAIAVRLPEDKKTKKEKINLSLFDGYPDPTEAKADAHVVCLKKALKHKNVTLKTNKMVNRLLTDESGTKITGVLTKTKKGKEKIYTGDLVVVSCGAINSAALLLRSANDQHPNGIANSSGLIGRNLMLHNNGTVVAISKEENDSIFQKSLMLTEYYHGADDSKFPLGTIQMMGKTDPTTLKDELKDIDPDKTFDLEDVAKHSIDFFITSEDLPNKDNRVTLTKDGDIKLEYTPNNLEAYQRLRKKLLEMMDGIGCEEGYCKDTAYVGFKLGISGVSHQNGTCCFGLDSKTSVLDVNCKAHDLENLYVVDSSFFNSAGAVNPSLTIIANALRVGDHIKENL